MKKKILIRGLPGSGKTTFARELADSLGCVWWNADEVRAMFNATGFSNVDRMQQAQRMAFLCDVTLRAAKAEFVIADFVCPTAETFKAFAPDFTVLISRTNSSRYPDTDAIFQRLSYNFIVFGDGGYGESVGNCLAHIRA